MLLERSARSMNTETRECIVFRTDSGVWGDKVSEFAVRSCEPVVEELGRRFSWASQVPGPLRPPVALKRTDRNPEPYLVCACDTSYNGKEAWTLLQMTWMVDRRCFVKAYAGTSRIDMTMVR